MRIPDFQKMKEENNKISMVTCYDFTSAQIVSQSNVDCILVGDSLAMTMHGYASTLPATLELMALHVSAVVRGATNKLIIADLPFLSYRINLSETMRAVQHLIQAGAQAVKLEGANGNLAAVEHIVQSGVPVMGHIGLTPQALHQLGGFTVQGKHKQTADDLLMQASQLAAAGCFALVLECIPSELARRITEQISIPTIGIGAGPHTSGQVLVWQDILGLNQMFRPKFLKNYLQGFALIKNALNEYHRDVKAVIYPDEIEHTY